MTLARLAFWAPGLVPDDAEWLALGRRDECDIVESLEYVLQHPCKVATGWKLWNDLPGMAELVLRDKIIPPSVDYNVWTYFVQHFAHTEREMYRRGLALPDEVEEWVVTKRLPVRAASKMKALYLIGTLRVQLPVMPEGALHAAVHEIAAAQRTLYQVASRW
jgi:hypothetical protein